MNKGAYMLPFTENILSFFLITYVDYLTSFLAQLCTVVQLRPPRPSQTSGLMGQVPPPPQMGCFGLECLLTDSNILRDLEVTSVIITGGGFIEARGARQVTCTTGCGTYDESLRTEQTGRGKGLAAANLNLCILCRASPCRIFRNQCVHGFV